MTEPRVVAVGGGHGLAATLRAVRRYTPALTAVVSVADDGGSSGRLRSELGIMPPGDLRKCLVALAEEGSVLAEIFEHRFDVEEDGLAGHALGNLVIAALMARSGGVQGALDEAARLVGAKGKVVPATLQPVVLKAEAEAGWVEGQSAIVATGRIRHITLIPEDPQASPEAIRALAGAEQVVIGPGSLYTSVLAAAAVPDIADAIRRSPGRRVYVANLRPEEAETQGYDVAAHVVALRSHGVEVDVVLADTSAIALGELSVPVVITGLAKGNGRAHDPLRLASALEDLLG